MKVLFPRHIKKGIFSTMTFTIGPITVNIFQLFIIVIGLASSFGVANYLVKHGHAKIIAIAASSPLTLIACAIAFFEVSEMGLIEFLAKIARTHFFDSTVKYQVNVQKHDPIDLLIKKSHTEEQSKTIQFKTQKGLLAHDTEDKIKESWLL